MCVVGYTERMTYVVPIEIFLFNVLFFNLIL